MRFLDWVKCEKDNWCSLEKLNLSHAHFKNLKGVYVIFYLNVGFPTCVRVGQGDVADRLGSHRGDPEVVQYSENGNLLATWASAVDSEVDGLEVYLAQVLNPLVGTNFPDVEPINCNLPW